MKNSEIKTIIRHIDRLTRNLNARGRRRYADAQDEQQRRNIESAASAVKNWSRKVLDAVFDIQNDCKNLFPELAKNGDFEQIKKFAKQDIDGCKTLVKALNQVIAFCDEGIKAKIY